METRHTVTYTHATTHLQELPKKDTMTQRHKTHKDTHTQDAQRHTHTTTHLQELPNKIRAFISGSLDQANVPAANNSGWVGSALVRLPNREEVRGELEYFNQ